MSQPLGFLGVVFALIQLQPLLAQAQISVGSRLTDDTEVEPGSSYTRTILVNNGSSTAQQVKIYQTDYLFSSDGANFYGEPGSTARSNADWIRLGASIITIPPHEDVSIPYTVEVPEQADSELLTGSYWSLIMIEGVPSRSLESTLSESDSTPQFGVQTILRFAVQVATHIRGTGRPSLTMSSPSIVRSDDGAYELLVELDNDGSRMARLDTWVELYDQEGMALGRHNAAGNGRLYPGTSVLKHHRLSDLPPGDYRALVILDAGGGQVDASEYTVSIQ